MGRRGDEVIVLGEAEGGGEVRPGRVHVRRWRSKGSEFIKDGWRRRRRRGREVPGGGRGRGPGGRDWAKRLRVPRNRRRGRRRQDECRAGKCLGSVRGRVRRQPHEGELGESDAPVAAPALACAGRVPSLRGGRSGRGRGGSQGRKQRYAGGQGRGHVDGFRSPRAVRFKASEPRGTTGSERGRWCEREVLHSTGRIQGRSSVGIVRSCTASSKEIAEVVLCNGPPRGSRD